MNSSTQKKLVQMRFNEKTINRVQELKAMTGINIKTQIVARAIALYHEIEKSKKEKGGELYMEYPDGKRERFVIVG